MTEGQKGRKGDEEEEEEERKEKNFRIIVFTKKRNSFFFRYRSETINKLTVAQVTSWFQRRGWSFNSAPCNVCYRQLKIAKLKMRPTVAFWNFSDELPQILRRT